jgi:hypothetical protein
MYQAELKQFVEKLVTNEEVGQKQKLTKGFADQLLCKQITQTVCQLRIRTRNSSSASYFPKARKQFGSRAARTQLFKALTATLTGSQTTL